MAVTKAYKRKFDYLDKTQSKEYLSFLKRHFVGGNANFYSVAKQTKLNTPDGIMYALNLVTELNNPDLEPIAESWINGRILYLWRDQCWVIAKNKFGRDIMKLRNSQFLSYANLDNPRLSSPRNKSLIVYSIGDHEEQK